MRALLRMGTALWLAYFICLNLLVASVYTKVDAKALRLGAPRSCTFLGSLILFCHEF